jgi:hypothetical protein
LIYKKKRKVQTPTLAFLINLPENNNNNNNNNNNETGQKFTIKHYTCKTTDPVYMQTKIREPVSKTTTAAKFQWTGLDPKREQPRCVVTTT